MARQEGIGGVYLPFWDCGAASRSRYHGARGEYYFETETYQESDGRGGTVVQTRQVQRTAWYPAAGEVSRQFTDVLIAASGSVSESKLDALEPWCLEELCPYEPAYLAGFKAQRYQVELAEGFEKAKGVMLRTIEADVRRGAGRTAVQRLENWPAGDPGAGHCGAGHDSGVEPVRGRSPERTPTSSRCASRSAGSW